MAQEASQQQLPQPSTPATATVATADEAGQPAPSSSRPDLLRHLHLHASHYERGLGPDASDRPQPASQVHGPGSWVGAAASAVTGWLAWGRRGAHEQAEAHRVPSSSGVLGAAAGPSTDGGGGSGGGAGSPALPTPWQGFVAGAVAGAAQVGRSAHGPQLHAVASAVLLVPRRCAPSAHQLPLPRPSLLVPLPSLTLPPSLPPITCASGGAVVAAPRAGAAVFRRRGDHGDLPQVVTRHTLHLIAPLLRVGRPLQVEHVLA